MITRRTFIRRVLQVGGTLTGLTAATTTYGFWEASQIRIVRQTIPIPNLPEAFVGKKVAVLADLHHGPLVGLDFIREAVRLTNSLQPDLIALVGDYAHWGARTHVDLPPCLEVLSGLRAALGVFAVPGNHDMQNQGRVYREVISSTPIIDLTNRAHCLSQDQQHLWMTGVDDLWWGKPDLMKALQEVPLRSAVVLLCHNPDFAETCPSRRVGLVLSGHTHGGQVDLPLVGSLWIPSRFGAKYRQGLVQGPGSLVFVSRGLGLAGLPVRINAPPEINWITLAAA